MYGEHHQDRRDVAQSDLASCQVCEEGNDEKGDFFFFVRKVFGLDRVGVAVENKKVKVQEELKTLYVKLICKNMLKQVSFNVKMRYSN